MKVIRNRFEADDPGLTMIGMYNVLEKLRSGEPLTDSEKTVTSKGWCRSFSRFMTSWMPPCSPPMAGRSRSRTKRLFDQNAWW